MGKQKGFTDISNPALRFMSEVTLEQEQAQPELTQPLDQTQTQPVKKVKERKSKRLQLLVYPSVYDSVKKIADAEGESVNEIINTILKKHFEKE